MRGDKGLQSCKDALLKHVLEPVGSTRFGDPLFAFHMRDPERGRCMSTLITFSPEGITITGDLTPTGRGVASSFGYHFGWFRSELSPDYLCEKFLEKKYIPELAIAHLMDSYQDACLAEEFTQEEKKEKGEAIEKAVERGLEDQVEAVNFYREIFGDYPESFGYGFDPGEANWLIAIQQRFAELADEYIAENPGILAGHRLSA